MFLNEGVMREQSGGHMYFGSEWQCYHIFYHHCNIRSCADLCVTSACVDSRGTTLEKMRARYSCV